MASVKADAGRVFDLGPGLLVAALVFAVYGGLALSVDFPKAAFGFQSDEATYYLMAHSLARDGDLTYRKEDLARVWHEFPSGPSGIFLKKGRDVDGVSFSTALPYLRIDSHPDGDPTRLFYGKSFAYPLLASPFVRAFGTNGFLVFHAVLLAAGVLAGYVFLSARSPAAVAAMLAAAFFMVSVAPGYFVWITPELFNLVVVLLGYFCWLYKEVAPAELPPGWRWLRGAASDLVGAVLLALATFSKPSNVLLIAPVAAWLVGRRQWGRAVGVGALFALVVSVLFLCNLAVTGDLNFQGGERNTYYGMFPFQRGDYGFEVGMDRATNTVLTDIVFDPEVFWSRLGWNLWYFVVGRHSGLLPYFFPAVFALVLFAWPGVRRAGWQYLVLLAALAEILLVVIWIPHNWFGGAGVLGNRYFMNAYGLFLFLFPSITRVATACVPWLVGGLFTAPIVLNPFYASFNPHAHAKSGPLRLLPIELTLINDLPINTRVDRVRVLFGQGPRFQIYFLDDNAYQRDGEGFWVKGDARADLILKTPEPVRTLKLTVSSPIAVRADVNVSGRKVRVDLAPNEQRVVQVPLGPGFPYQRTRAWVATIRVTGGFVPLIEVDGAVDHRHLGLFVTPEMLP